MNLRGDTIFRCDFFLRFGIDLREGDLVRTWQTTGQLLIYGCHLLAWPAPICVDCLEVSIVRAVAVWRCPTIYICWWGWWGKHTIYNYNSRGFQKVIELRRRRNLYRLRHLRCRKQKIGERSVAAPWMFSGSNCGCGLQIGAEERIYASRTQQWRSKPGASPTCKPDNQLKEATSSRGYKVPIPKC
jgi:hypothetical protein